MKTTILQTILFSDGKMGGYCVFAYEGACLTGDPTAYVIRDGHMVWVRPGESVAWIQA